MTKTYHLFSGNWCPMCVVALPEIMSTYKELNLDKTNLYFYDVNAFKTEPKDDIIKFNIKRVPTLVILDGDKEIGRITEYPNDSWGKDIKNLTLID